MLSYQDASIQRKLTFVILSTSLLGLSLACMAFEIYERASYRQAMTSELAALADTLGANTAAALAFNDRKSAEDMLGGAARRASYCRGLLVRRPGEHLRGVPARGGRR
jgi:hypothetical protein